MPTKVSDEVMEKWKTIRKKNTECSSMTMKMGTDDETIVMDGDIIDVTPEDLAEDMSESSPRWILWSMKISRDDGRIQQPLILVFFSPVSCNTKLRMIYSSRTGLLAEALKISKVHEIQDLDDITTENLKKLHISSITR
uniref:ADF-H domain-containing protein n=1 Tax=Hanusia phi TaxID=3032 RepID=A0A7S0E0J7_9CRYP